MIGNFLLGNLGSQRSCVLAKAVEDKTLGPRRWTMEYHPVASHPDGPSKMTKWLDTNSWMVSDKSALKEIEEILIENELKGIDCFEVASDATDFPEIFELNYMKARAIYESAGEKYLLRSKRLMRSLVPVVDPDDVTRENGIGVSMLYARGAVFLSIPDADEHKGLRLAINMAHEIGHQSLFNYQLSDKILNSDQLTPMYSVVRKTERPAIMSFHALTAVSFMIEFLNDLIRSSSLNSTELTFAKDVISKFKKDLRVGINVFSKANFTLLGKRMLSEFNELAEAVGQ